MEKAAKKGVAKKKAVWPMILAAFVAAVAVVVFVLWELGYSLFPSEDINPTDVVGKWSASGFTGTATDPFVFLTNNEGVVEGSYHGALGSKIVKGTISGNKVSAYWIESSSTRKCNTPLGDAPNWGRVEFAFNSKFDQFAGKWGYCDDYISKKFVGNRAQ